MDLVVTTHCEDVVTVEVHHRPGVAEFGLERQRVREDLGVERIDVADRDCRTKVVMVSLFQ